MTTPSSLFASVSTVAIAVSDQDRAKAFFEAVGLQTRFDAEVAPDFRWVELVTPDGSSISVIAGNDDLPPGVDTGIRFVTDDARAAHADLVGRGVSVGELLDWPTAPLMFTFCDADGNRFYVTEPIQ